MSDSWLEVGVLAIVQGLTEFLPVSSSGHLALLQHLFGVEGPQLLLDVMLHAGTLAAVLMVFRGEVQDLIREGLRGVGPPEGEARPPARRVAFYLLLGTLVTALGGLLLHDRMEFLLEKVSFLGPFWILTGTVLWLTRWSPSRKRVMGAWDALLVGLAQTAALAPGISRSGMTIAVGLLLGWDRRWAASFSFLLAIPAVLGAVVLELLRQEPGAVEPSVLLMGGCSPGGWDGWPSGGC